MSAPNNKGLLVYLADDHEIVAKAIAGLLLSIESIGEVRTFLNGKDLLAACKTAMPGLVILDIEMPGWNGIETLEKVKELGTVPVIMLTMSDEKAMVEKAVQVGAAGYLHKNCSLPEMKEAIESVAAGKLFLSEEVKKIMVGLKSSGEGFTGLSEPITEKEMEVLQLVCDGLTSKEIGEKLFLSPRTVETRKNSLMQKFNVQTTGKMIAIAIKNKIVR